MQINFVYSHVYFQMLNAHKKVDRTWEEVVRLGRSFEERYKREIKEIAETIPKVINQNWKEDVIDVYFVDWCGPSFSNPLTLKVREDLLLILVILTHELIHHFKLDKPKGYEREKQINDYVEEVFKDLRIEANSQIETMRSFSAKRYLNRE